MRENYSNPLRSFAGAAIVVGILLASMFFADPADAARIKPGHGGKARVVHVEPDNGRSLMWGLSNGAAFKTARPAACKREARPRLCRAAYRKAVRTYGCWWRKGNMSGYSVKDCQRKRWDQ